MEEFDYHCSQELHSLGFRHPGNSPQILLSLALHQVSKPSHKGRISSEVAPAALPSPTLHCRQPIIRALGGFCRARMRHSQGYYNKWAPNFYQPHRFKIPLPSASTDTLKLCSPPPRLRLRGRELIIPRTQYPEKERAEQPF